MSSGMSVRVFPETGMWVSKPRAKPALNVCNTGLDGTKCRHGETQLWAQAQVFLRGYVYPHCRFLWTSDSSFFSFEHELTSDSPGNFQYFGL
jgi:hypothetical protein